MTTRKDKLSAFLAQLKTTASQGESALKALIDKFKKQQGLFKGVRGEWLPLEEGVAAPTNTNTDYNPVNSTVDDQLKYFIELYSRALRDNLTRELSNIKSQPINVVINNTDYYLYGPQILCILNYLRKLRDLIEAIPTLDLSKTWDLSVDPAHAGSQIWVRIDNIVKYERKVTPYILIDHNVQAALAAGKTINYTPVVKEEIQERPIGNNRITYMSSEVTHYRKAEMLRRLSEIIIIFEKALEDFNSTEITEAPQMKSLLEYILFAEA